MRLGPLAEGWFRPLTHASFVYLPSINELKIDTAKLCMLNAAYLRSEKISQIFMCFRIFVLVFVPMLMPKMWQVGHWGDGLRVIS